LGILALPFPNKRPKNIPYMQTWFSSALIPLFLFRILPLRFLFYSIFNISDCRFPLFCCPRKIMSVYGWLAAVVLSHHLTVIPPKWK
jgi:hypothetical protein